ncbi:DUF2510 domain-containing protein [Microbacterium sp.]|uniref:DUF2510 domain-containing protein n=1 Tax=Microbacterium sp. TaxID=51671 RepID=UPI0025DA1183|nr:DUF2510 domain-containing protein [Microbacterium sp.]
MSTPAGWYPDPSGAAGTRWWDGAQWTPHTIVPAVPRAKVDVPTDTVWIWLATAASVAPFFSVFLLDARGFIDAVAATAAIGRGSSYLLSWQLNALVVSLVGWGAIALYIVFSWLDWRELGRRGVVQPFHWAWSFFGLLVYLIGRSVVLRDRVVKASSAPLWVWIAATVVGFAVVLAWVFWFIGAVIAVFSQYS